MIDFAAKRVMVFTNTYKVNERIQKMWEEKTSKCYRSHELLLDFILTDIEEMIKLLNQNLSKLFRADRNRNDIHPLSYVVD